jgi:hypothetical protein
MMLAQLTARARVPFTERGSSGHMQATTAVVAQVHNAPVPLPTTTKEQYWAARAITAEALLSAKVVHHQELTTVSSEADSKRIVRA